MIDRRVLPHYEEAMRQALESPMDEICEMFLNQARGMMEALLLTRLATMAEFDREMQRQKQVRLTRQARGIAA